MIDQSVKFYNRHMSCSSGSVPILVGAAGSVINLPVVGNFGVIMGGALAGYVAEMGCQAKLLSPFDQSSLDAMSQGAMGGIAGIAAQVAFAAIAK